MRLRRPVGEHVIFGTVRAGMTPQEFTEEAAIYPKGVPIDRLPPADMPLRLEVLGALADDAETVYTMRNCGEMKPYGLALVGENALFSTLRDLLSEGLIEVESEYVIVDDQLIERQPHEPPATSDNDLKRYWFVMTKAGWAEWESGADEINSYHAAHPLESNR